MMMKKTSFVILMGLAGWIAGSDAAHADQLCPDTGKASDLAVSDVADLQYDIDRLSLCVQRARLLQQIDETVKKREELRMQPFGAPSTGLGAGPAVSIPAMPSLPELPKAVPLAPVSSSVQSAVPAAIASGEWKIQRIWGQGTGMQAQLAKDDVIANVKLNDVLPTGERVSELSARGVTLDNGKIVKSLKWLENVNKKDGSRIGDMNS